MARRKFPEPVAGASPSVAQVAEAWRVLAAKFRQYDDPAVRALAVRYDVHADEVAAGRRPAVPPSSRYRLPVFPPFHLPGERS